MSSRRFTNSQIDRLLRPKSVAVVGASDRHGALGATLLNNLVQYEFAGDIYPVNPKRDEIAGLKCYAIGRRICPKGIDCAVLAIPRPFVLDTVRQLAARGCGAVVIYSAGFSEAGEEGMKRTARTGRDRRRTRHGDRRPQLPGLHQLCRPCAAELRRNQHDDAAQGHARRGHRQPVGRARRGAGDHAASARLLRQPLRSRPATRRHRASRIIVEWLVDDEDTHVIAMYRRKPCAGPRRSSPPRAAHALAGKPI